MSKVVSGVKALSTSSHPPTSWLFLWHYNDAMLQKVISHMATRQMLMYVILTADAVVLLVRTVSLPELFFNTKRIIRIFSVFFFFLVYCCFAIYFYCLHSFFFESDDL